MNLRRGQSLLRTHTLATVVWGVVPVVLPLLLLVAWEISIRVGWLPPSLIATPWDVGASAIRMIADGTIFWHAWVSLCRLAVGFAFGSIAAIATGIIVGFSRLGERALAPTIAVIAPIPITAWIPLIVIISGVGEVSKSLVIALGVFFPVFFGTFQGIRSTDPKLVEVAHIYSKNSAQILIQVLWPSAIASILQSMRAALGLAWVLLIVAEVIASSAGLGWLMWDARNFGRPDDMIVGMITAGLLGAMTGRVLSYVESRLLFWRPAYIGQ